MIRWVLEYEPNCEWLLVDTTANRVLGYVLANGYRSTNNTRMFSAIIGDATRCTPIVTVQLTGTLAECAESLVRELRKLGRVP
jgi:hypothetical protein